MKYKLTLEVEIVCPEKEGEPELTITPTEIRDSLLKTWIGGGYAVCGSNDQKMTASMNVMSLEFHDIICGHCGHAVPVPVGGKRK